MNTTDTPFTKKLCRLTIDLYGGILSPSECRRITEEISNLAQNYKQLLSQNKAAAEDWYKKGAIYSTYVDLFAGSFKEFTSKLDYLESLGVNGLWVLPCLSSPMKDQGFDVSNFEKVRPELLETSRDEEFFDFIREAKKREIHIIFDITLNHCSKEHPWFIESELNPRGPKGNWFHWSKSDTQYGKARLLFKGIVESNWEYSSLRKEYFFHRFYPFQPDLNYSTPEVLIEMLSLLLRWKKAGVSGFRLDAIPFLWKEENTDCENLEKTHTILKIIRTVIDYCAPGTLLLAEACQPPKEVVKYFGEDDECNGAYHFPLMPMMYMAIAKGNGRYIKNILKEENTPAIPRQSQWFTFLRCHDELTLEMVSSEERKYLYEHYCHDPLWDFRCNEGISSRIFNLFKGNIDKIKLIYALLFSLPGTPIIYYGDEIGMENDVDFFHEKSTETGYRDSRFLVRGKMNWNLAENVTAGKDPARAEIFRTITEFISLKNSLSELTYGKLSFPDSKDGLFVIERKDPSHTLTAIFNLSPQEVPVADETIQIIRKGKIVAHSSTTDQATSVTPWGYIWIHQ